MNWRVNIMANWIYIGYVADTHGIKGELRIKSKFERKDLVFQKGMHLFFGISKKEEILVSYRPHKEFDMVLLEGYSNINEVLHLLHQDVFVKKEDLALQEDEYLYEDYIGCHIIEDEKDYGVIINVIQQGENIIFEVDGEHHFYLPYQKDYIVALQTAEKRMIAKNVTSLLL